MNAELLNKINEEVQNGAFGAICTVIHESGSTPRSRGASILEANNRETTAA